MLVEGGMFDEGLDEVWTHGRHVGLQGAGSKG